MANLDNYFVGDVEVGTPVTLEVDPDEPKNREKLAFHSKAHYQITAEGAGKLKVEAKVFGQTAFVVVAAELSGEIGILDLIDVQQLKLTATDSDVPTIISPSS